MNELRLSAGIYSESCIREGIGAFGDLASIRVTAADGAYILRFEDCVYDPAETMAEFENYLIGLTHRSMTK